MKKTVFYTLFVGLTLQTYYLWSMEDVIRANVPTWLSAWIYTETTPSPQTLQPSLASQNNHQMVQKPVQSLEEQKRPPSPLAFSQETTHDDNSEKCCGTCDTCFKPITCSCRCPNLSESCLSFLAKYCCYCIIEEPFCACHTPCGDCCCFGCVCFSI